MAGPWEKYQAQGAMPPAQPQQAQPQAQPQPRGPVYGPPLAPDMPSQAENARLAMEQQRLAISQNQQVREERSAELANQKSQLEIDAMLAKQAGQQKDMQTELLGIANVIRSARQAKQLSRDGWFATGFGAETAAKTLGGTTAADVAALVNTIGSNTAFDRLQKMREESPTGGALGGIAVPELMMLRDSVAGLGINQSDEQFQRNMDVVIQAYENVYRKLGGDLAALASQDYNTGATAGEAVNQAARATPLGPRELRAVAQYVASNPNLTNDQLDQWMSQEFGQKWENTDEVIGYIRQNGSLPPYGGMTPAQSPTPTPRTPPGGYIDADGTVVGELNPQQQQDLAATVAHGMRLQGIEGDPGLSDQFFQGVTFGLDDELAGLDAAGRAIFRGDVDNVARNYRAGRDAQRARVEQARNENGWLGTGVELASGLLTGATEAKGAIAGGNALLNAAKSGAKMGGLYGYGSGEGLEGSATNALLGAGLGGVAGAGLQAAAPRVNALLSRRANRPNVNASPNERAAAAPILAASERQNIPVRLPDVRPSVRGEFSALETTPTVGPQIANALASDTAAIENALARVSPGRTLDPFDAGQKLQGLMDRQKVTAKAHTANLYDEAERLLPGYSARPRQTVAAIDEMIAAERAAAPTGSRQIVRLMQDIKSDIEATGLSIKSLQGVRKTIRNKVASNSIDRSAADALLMRINAVATKEFEDSVGAFAPQHLARLREANASHAAYLKFRSEVAERFIGKDGTLRPEAAARNFTGMLSAKGGDLKAFTKMMAQATPEDRLDLGATLASRLGRGNGDVFQVGRFATEIEGMNPKSIKLLFGEDGARAIDDLRILARAKSDTMRGLNHSRTGQTVSAQTGGVKDLLLSAFGYGTGGVTGAVAFPIARRFIQKLGDERAARLMLSPDFTKWLRQAPQSNNPRVINAHLGRLNAIVARNPIIANDIGAMQQALSEAFSKSPDRVAASDDENNGGGKPPAQ